MSSLSVAIAIENLSKSFRGRAVLSGLTLRAEAGSRTAIIGHSGSGKSTLLRCITGLERFDEGRVTVGEAVLRSKSSAAELANVRRRVGMVFQGLHLFPHRTALENVTEAPIFVRGLSPSEAQGRASELLALVGLTHREGAYPSELSGGEQQRVAIARALAMDPDVLLLDEPTSALDPSRRREITGTLRKLGERGITVVVVTHEMSFARDVSEQVVVLHEGTVIERGDTAKIFGGAEDPRTRALLEA